MFLLKSRDNATKGVHLATLGATSEFGVQRDVFSGEINPRNILTGLSIIVMVLHILLLSWMQQTGKLNRDKKPVIMDIALIVPPKPLPMLAPPPAPEPPKPQVVEKKPITPPKPKPVMEKKPVVQPKPQPVKPVVEEKIEPSDFPVFNSEPVKPAPAPQPASTASASAETSTNTYVEANYKANYASNPKPDYPSIAKDRGWEGKVLLKVEVSAAGHSESVNIHKSSGHEILDEAAVEAVKQWKFIPAKRGDTPVASSVIVPITFKLDD
jgi:protein TonB